MFILVMHEFMPTTLSALHMNSLGRKSYFQLFFQTFCTIIVCVFVFSFEFISNIAVPGSLYAYMLIIISCNQLFIFNSPHFYHVSRIITLDAIALAVQNVHSYS